MGEKIPSRLTLTDIDAQAAIAARVASEQYYAQERAKLQAQERAKLQSAAVEQSAISNGIEHGIQKRIASDEVQKLNDRVKQLNDNAQFVLFGSKLDTKTGNEAGDLDINSSLTQQSTFDALLKTRASKEIEALQAKYLSYNSELTSLLEEGLELSQAQLVMDLRAGDYAKEVKLVLASTNDQKPMDQMIKKRDQLIKKYDQKRLKLIKEGGAFTLEDYKRLRRGERLYDKEGNYISQPFDSKQASNKSSESDEPKSPDTDDPNKASNSNDKSTMPDTSESKPESEPDTATDNNEEPESEPDTNNDPTNEEQLDIDSLLTEYEKAQFLEAIDRIRATKPEFQNYANVTAQRRQSHIFAKRVRGYSNPLSGQKMYRNKKVNEELVLASGKLLDAVRLESIKELQEKLASTGLRPAEIEKKILGFNKLFMASLNAAHTVSWQEESQKLLKNPNGLRARFYNWWLEQAGAGDIYFGDSKFKGNIKKAAVLIGAGAVAGAAGLVNPGLGLVAGLGAVKFFASDYSRALGALKLGQESDDEESAKSGKGQKSSRQYSYGQLRGISTRNWLERYLDKDYVANANKPDAIYQGPQRLTREFYQDVEEEVSRNRLRVVGSVGAIALGGVGVGVVL